tara:strand:+ start:158 stop:286 length:129 start_codon:yes stop_codon:yes gene_type:complete
LLLGVLLGARPRALVSGVAVVNGAAAKGVVEAEAEAAEAGPL